MQFLSKPQQTHRMGQQHVEIEDYFLCCEVDLLILSCLSMIICKIAAIKQLECRYVLRSFNLIDASLPLYKGKHDNSFFNNRRGCSFVPPDKAKFHNTLRKKL